MFITLLKQICKNYQFFSAKKAERSVHFIDQNKKKSVISIDKKL